MYMHTLTIIKHCMYINYIIIITYTISYIIHNGYQCLTIIKHCMYINYIIIITYTILFIMDTNDIMMMSCTNCPIS